jgi:hypothetical protein
VPLSALQTLTLTLFDDTATVPLAPGSTAGTPRASSTPTAGRWWITEPRRLSDLVLSAADNPLVTAGKRAEWHIAFFVWTWTGGGPGEKAYAFRVRAKP